MRARRRPTRGPSRGKGGGGDERSNPRRYRHVLSLAVAARGAPAVARAAALTRRSRSRWSCPSRRAAGPIPSAVRWPASPNSISASRWWSSTRAAAAAPSAPSSWPMPSRTATRVLYALNNLTEIPQIDELLGRTPGLQEGAVHPDRAGHGDAVCGHGECRVALEDVPGVRRRGAPEARRVPVRLGRGLQHHALHVGDDAQGHRPARPAHADHRRRPDHDGSARQARRHRPLRGAGGVRATGRGAQDSLARDDVRQAPAAPTRTSPR